VRNNTLATRVMADVAVEYGTQRFVLVSTDKAANPKNLLGQSKALCEWIVEAYGHRKDISTRFVAVRFGNVLGSRGSVLGTLSAQVEAGGPLTVTHPEATRYFLTMDEACTAIGALANLQDAAGLYLPEMGEPIFILGLAERMIRAAAAVAKGHAEISVKITGLRPGDKLHEDLLSHAETAGAEAAAGIRAIYGEKIHAELLDTKFRMIEEITMQRDLGALLDVLQEVVPEYQPGPHLTKKWVVAAAGAGDD